MPSLASDIMTSAAGFLNDPNKRRFTYAALLPYMKRAYRELEDYLDLNGIRTLDEVSAVITVDAGDTTLTLPSDFVSPIYLEERAAGATGGLFSPMQDKRWEPDEQQGPFLNIWVWREEQVHFLGATADREVKMKYKKSLTPITSENSAIGVAKSDNFLESRVAAMAALYIGENPSRAGALQADAGAALDILLRRGVKTTQGRSFRRRRYGTSWRRL